MKHLGPVLVGLLVLGGLFVVFMLMGKNASAATKPNANAPASWGGQPSAPAPVSVAKPGSAVANLQKAGNGSSLTLALAQVSDALTSRGIKGR